MNNCHKTIFYFDTVSNKPCLCKNCLYFYVHLFKHIKIIKLQVTSELMFLKKRKNRNVVIFLVWKTQAVKTDIAVYPKHDESLSLSVLQSNCIHNQNSPIITLKAETVHFIEKLLQFWKIVKI